jgi:hypothetical protein
MVGLTRYRCIGPGRQEPSSRRSRLPAAARGRPAGQRPPWLDTSKELLSETHLNGARARNRARRACLHRIDRGCSSGIGSCLYRLDLVLLDQDKVAVRKPTSVYSNWVWPRYGSFTITYNETKSYTNSASVTSTVSVSANGIFASA